MSFSFSENELKKYSNLLTPLFADACELAVLRDDGELIFLTQNDKEVTIQSLANRFVGELVKRESEPQTVSISIDKHLLMASYLDLPEEGAQVVLLFDRQHDNFKAISEKSALSEFVVAISDIVSADIMAIKELDDMANELAERYEELNLVYDTESQLQDVNKVYLALKEIVSGCLNYLNVELSLIYLPEKDIFISSGSSVESSESKDGLLRVTQDLYDELKDAKASLVLNDAGAVKQQYIGFDHKVLAVPIKSDSEVFEGILMIAKENSKPDFTNSDRNLLEVMAKKATRIVISNYDSLTGLLNREAFERRVSDLFSKSEGEQQLHALLNIDLDDFQVVNETFGHEIGDKVLVSVANVIRQHVRDSDAVSRLSSDQFAVLLYNCLHESGLSIAQIIAEAIKAIDLSKDDKVVELSASIGVAIIDGDTLNMEVALGDAEVAKDAAKEAGKNRVMVFERDDSELVTRRENMKWVSRIRAGLRENRFVLFAQPIVPLGEKGISHIEILLRMTDEKGKLHSPFAFIPAAESYHLMPDIDRWVIASTLTTLILHEESYPNKPLNVAINLSGQSFSNESFLEFVIGWLERINFPASRITFEVTESAAISNMIKAHRFISEVKSKGCQFSLDDFGTGLSSFSYLKELPVDYLKIDGSFIKDILNDPVAETMVSAINQVGHVMKLETIAEYVENDDIKAHLAVMGVDYGQGYGIAKPCALTDFIEQMQ